MTLGNKLAALRKKNNYTQEQFAELMGVSRQAVSKWENDLAYPETEKLIQIGKLYGCSMDCLLCDELEMSDEPADRAGSTDSTESAAAPEQSCKAGTTVVLNFPKLIRERKSEKTLWGLPLWHIGKNAHGIIAVGLTARGVISIGLLSAGVLSVGLLSLGILALGTFALGLFSAGSIAIGVISAGAIAFGVVSFGALSIGDFSFGALAVGKYFAKGDDARAMVALGHTHAEGSVFRKVGDLSEVDRIGAAEALDTVVPGILGWAKHLVRSILLH